MPSQQVAARVTWRARTLVAVAMTTGAMLAAAGMSDGPAPIFEQLRADDQETSQIAELQPLAVPPQVARCSYCDDEQYQRLADAVAQRHYELIGESLAAIPPESPYRHAAESLVQREWEHVVAHAEAHLPARLCPELAAYKRMIADAWPSAGHAIENIDCPFVCGTPFQSRANAEQDFQQTLRRMMAERAALRVKLDRELRQQLRRKDYAEVLRSCQSLQHWGREVPASCVEVACRLAEGEQAELMIKMAPERDRRGAFERCRKLGIQIFDDGTEGSVLRWTWEKRRD